MKFETCRKVVSEDPKVLCGEPTTKVGPLRNYLCEKHAEESMIKRMVRDLKSGTLFEPWIVLNPNCPVVKAAGALTSDWRWKHRDSCDLCRSVNKVYLVQRPGFFAAYSASGTFLGWNSDSATLREFLEKKGQVVIGAEVVFAIKTPEGTLIKMGD